MAAKSQRWWSRFARLMLANALLASCSATSNDGTTTPVGGEGTKTSATDSDSGPAPSRDDDPYANVVAVSVTGEDGDHTFNVSVESADIDCSQFADWWEVLSVDGALLYRRVILHSHTDENGTSDADAPGNTFTRSGGPVPIDSSEVVIVRAHMNVGGYNGVAMRGTAAEGFTEAPDIDSSFALGVEGQEPQPQSCAF